MKFFSRRSIFAFIARGFTLVEMLIVLGIFFVISSIVLLNYKGFGSDLLLTNLSYDIALQLRRAQSYGVSVKSISDAEGFVHAYGVHFDQDQATFKFFIDINDNEVFDPGDGPPIEIYNINNQDRIFRLCYKDTSDGSSHCTNGGGNNPNAIDVLFKRPDPDAKITICVSEPLPSCQTGKAIGQIDIVSVRGLHRYVTVRDTGEISVNSTSLAD